MPASGRISTGRVGNGCVMPHFNASKGIRQLLFEKILHQKTAFLLI
jgi:hypothetical protein